MTIYYLSAILFDLIKKEKYATYQSLNDDLLSKELNSCEHTDENFTLALDFLFLLGLITVNDEGRLHVCPSTTNLQ